MDKLIKTVGMVWQRFQALNPRLVGFAAPNVRLDRRLTRTAGQMEFDKKLIRLSASFYDEFPSEFETVIIPHEIAHYADFILYPDTLPENWHIGTWASLMTSYGLPPDEFHTLLELRANKNS